MATFGDAELRRLTDAEAARLVRLYQQAERDLLDAVSRALARGNQTAYLQGMLSNARAILSGLQAGSRTWSEDAIPRMYSVGAQVADDQLRQAGITTEMGFGAIHQQAAQVLAEATFARLQDSDALIGRRIDDIYRTLTLANVKGSVIGYESWQQAKRRLLDDLAEHGITGFVDRAGRNWNMKTYAEMAAVTSTAQAHWEGTANRLLEHGHDLVRISSHPRSCPLCAPWQDQIVSLTGKTEGYPSMDEARSQGFQHPHCRHAFGLYIDLEGETKDADARAAAADRRRRVAEANRKAEEEALAALQRRKPIRLDGWGTANEAQTKAAQVQEQMLRDSGGDALSTAESISGPRLAAKLADNADALAFADYWEKRRGHDPSGYTPADRLTWLSKAVVSTWNGTSADDNELALGMQIAAGAEFGVADAVPAFWQDKTAWRSAQALYAEQGAGMRAVLRGMHALTQEWFAARGITEVPLFRGARWPRQAWAGGIDFPYEGLHETKTQPLNSWSLDPDKAVTFASGNTYKMVMAGVVPVERIISVPATGSGTVFEREMVVIGGTDTMAVYTTSGRLPFFSEDLWGRVADTAKGAG